MTDRKTIAESVRAALRARVSVLPDAPTIEEAEVLHFHHRGAAVGTVHRWKDGSYRKTSQGWEPLPEPVTHAVAAPSKAPAPAEQPHAHNAPVAPAPKADAATRHEPVAEPVPAAKPVAPSVPAPSAKVHAGRPHPAPEGIDPQRGPYSDSPGSLTKHAEWARAIEPGHEVEARWTNNHNFYRGRGVVTKVNDNSVRVRLAHNVGRDMYGSGLHAYHRGREVTVPLYSGRSMAAMARHSHENGTYPVGDKTPSADHETHTHAVMQKSLHGHDAGKAHARQTYPSKEAADAAAEKANASSGARTYGFQYSVAELPEPITSQDVPVSDHVHVHSVMRNDGIEQERFGTEHAAREKVRSMNDYHARAGLRFHYRRLDQPGLPRQGGAQAQAAVDMKVAGEHAARKAAIAADHQKQADDIAAKLRIGGGAPVSATAEPAPAAGVAEPSVVAAATARAAELGLPAIPPLSKRHRDKARADRVSYGHAPDDAKEHAISQPEDVPLSIAPRPDDVSPELHASIVDFAKHFHAAHVADKVASGFTHEVHKQNFGVNVHYKRGNAYVDVGSSGRYMIPTVPGKGKAASVPVGTVRTIRAYGQAHPFHQAGNVVDGTAQDIQRRNYLSTVKNGYAFKE